MPFSSLFGIIPAYAGSTELLKRQREVRQDHPRIRGEHSYAPSSSAPPMGSSPHTRGARFETIDIFRQQGIIPAYAGSTSTPAPPIVSHRDHPRIRGEHRETPARRRILTGSSPHTRGAPTPSRNHQLQPRIIPAYAGSTPVCVRVRSRRWDHPRIRGEHRLSGLYTGDGQGSSPHTRGARHERLERRFLPRIIPAYAGSTF